MHDPTVLDRLNRKFEKSHPQDVLRWIAETYGSQAAVVTSFQPTGIVTLHMLYEMGLQLPVLTLDTGLLFPETYALMDEVERHFRLRLTRVRPAQTVSQQAQAQGDALWERDSDACCNLRKVVPLARALTPYDGWITGLRRDQSERRRHTPVVGWDERHGKAKFSPLALWTEDMLWTYIYDYDLPYNTLHEQGYPSIGCWPCTRAVEVGADTRAGRWAGSIKTECGIHVA
jgi:phosphoadenosine phosphosulfate reductase